MTSCDKILYGTLMASTVKALSISSLLQEIIWNLHGNCPTCHKISLPESMQIFDRQIYESECISTHRTQLLHCILVSKFWSEVAIPQLWGYYESGLLAHITDDRMNIQIDVMLNYARFIRRLHVSHVYLGKFANRLYELVPFINERSPFSNLKELSVAGYCLNEPSGIEILSFLLSNSKVKKVIVEGHIEDADTFSLLSRCIIEKSPGLTHLWLEYGVIPRQNNQDILGPLVSILDVLTSLRSISLPPNWFETSVLDAISKLPKVEYLSFFEGEISVSKYFTFDFTSKLAPGTITSLLTFPTLTFLNLIVSSDDLDLISTGILARTEGLSALTLSYYGEVDVKSFHAKISRQLPDLQSLTLIANFHFAPSFELESIHTFTRCAKLVELSVDHLHLSSDELIALCQSWPNLKILTVIERVLSRVCRQYFGSFELIPQSQIAGPDLNVLAALPVTLGSLTHLKLTLVASPTDQLPIEPRRFNRNFESLTLSTPFLNYALPGFSEEDAVTYINSLIWPWTECHFIDENEFENSDESQYEDNDFFSKEEYCEGYERFLQSLQHCSDECRRRSNA